MNPHPLLLALQDRRRSWPSLLALPALVGLLAVGLTVAAKLPPARVAAALTAAGVFALWGLLSHSLILQNRASLAQLVPGHTRALRRLLLAGSLASCLLIVLLLRGAGLRLSGLELALMASALMAAVGWMQAVPLPGPLLGFAWAIGLSQGIDGLRQHGPLLSDTVSGLGPLAWGLVLAPLVSLRWALSAGGATHVVRQRRRDGIRAMQQRLQRGEVSLGTRSAQALPARLSAWEWRRVQTQGPMRRVAWLLLRPLTAPQMLLQSATVLLMLVLLAWLLGRVLPGYWTMVESELGAVLLPLFGLMAWLIGWLSSRLHNTRREQALLLLLPGVPRGPALARAWRREALGHALRGGIACIVPALVYYLISAPMRAPLVLLTAGLAAPVLLGALRHPAQMGRGRWVMGVPVLLLLAAMPGAFLPAWLLGASLAACGLTLLLAPLFWRRLAGGAEPFPAGRYSGNSV
jgi:hypothetical protein